MSNSESVEERAMPPPPPRFQWMRPRMQGFAGKITLYTRDRVIRDIPTVLIRVGGQQLYDRFLQGPFRYIMELNRRDVAIGALHELLARELKDPSISEFERMFSIGGREIVFGPREWAIVTGLSFGPSAFNPYGRKHIIPLTSLYHTKYGKMKAKVKSEQLKADFLKDHIESPLGTADQYVKAANLLVYYFILMSRDDPPIEDWAWALVEDEEQWRRFPWGSWSWQILCHQLGVVKKDPAEIDNKQGKYHLYGPVWGLNLWAYEAIPMLGQACGYIDPAKAELVPRLRKWETYSTYTTMAGFFDNTELQVHQRLLPSEQELREPYLLGFEDHDPLVLRYQAPKRHALKKVEPEERKSKAARDMAKVLEKLKCRVVEPAVVPRRQEPRPTRAYSDGLVPIPPLRLDSVDRATSEEVKSRRHRPDGQSKRPRAEASRLEDSSEVVCCIHGDPCRLGCRGDDAAMDKFIDRFGERLVHDTSENSIVARFARAIVERAKGLVGDTDRPSRSRRSPSKSYNSHVGERQSMGSSSRTPSRQSIMGEGSRKSSRRTPTHQPGPEEPRRPPSPLPSTGQASSSHGSFIRELELDTPSPPPTGQASPESEASDFEAGPRVDQGIQLSTQPITVRETYNKFRKRGGDASVSTCQASPFELKQHVFDLIENPNADIDAEIVDLYILYWRCRLRRRRWTADSVGYSVTILPGVDYYKLLNKALADLHPDDASLGLKKRLKYANWEVPANLISVFEGTDTYIPWHLGKYFIMVCHLSTQHWAVVRICIPEWKVEVYDSLWHSLTKDTERTHRKVQFLCICRLFPRVLAKSIYWRQQGNMTKRTDFMKLVFMPTEQQFLQRDGVSCGVYACMYLDRLLSFWTPALRHEDELKFILKSRARMARRIFSLSIFDVEGPVELRDLVVDV